MPLQRLDFVRVACEHARAARQVSEIGIATSYHSRDLVLLIELVSLLTLYESGGGKKIDGASAPGSSRLANGRLKWSTNKVAVGRGAKDRLAGGGRQGPRPYSVLLRINRRGGLRLKGDLQFEYWAARGAGPSDAGTRAAPRPAWACPASHKVAVRARSSLHCAASGGRGGGKNGSNFGSTSLAAAGMLGTGLHQGISTLRQSGDRRRP